MNNNIQESYCSFEVSKLLKSINYHVKSRSFFIVNNEKSIDFIENGNSNGDFNNVNWVRTWRRSNVDDTISCPTHSSAIEWIRVNFGIWIAIFSTDDIAMYSYKITSTQGHNYSPNYNSPQEATEAGLLYTLQKLIP